VYHQLTLAVQFAGFARRTIGLEPLGDRDGWEEWESVLMGNIDDRKVNMAVSLWRLTFETGTVHRYLSPSRGYMFLCLLASFIIYHYLQDLSEPKT